MRTLVLEQNRKVLWIRRRFVYAFRFTLSREVPVPVEGAAEGRGGLVELLHRTGVEPSEQDRSVPQQPGFDRLPVRGQPAGQVDAGTGRRDEGGRRWGLRQKTDGYRIPSG